MVRKIFTIFFLLTVGLAASAQTWQLKVGGGFASQYSGSEVVGAYKFGVGYEYEFNQHWTFTPSLTLSGKGWKDKDVFVNDVDASGENKTDDEGNPILSRMGRSTNANYLEVPLIFNYYFRVGESRYVVIGAGPYVACGLWGKQETKGDGSRQGPEKLYYEEDTFDIHGTHRIDAGIQTFVGYQFRMGVTLGMEADFGLTQFETGGGRNISGLISLSYSFK